MKNIELIIENIFLTIKNNKFILQSMSSENIKKIFDDCDYNIILYKTPKWSDDATILKVVSPKTDFSLAIKIHEDKYPLASNVYDDSSALLSLSSTGYATQIFKTHTILFENIQYRIVFYKFEDGKSLGSLLLKAKENDIYRYKTLLSEAVIGLLTVGFNAFVRDLDDFLLIKNGKRIVITDYNAIMDCRHSNIYSRENVMSIVDNIIDKIVSPEYKPFVSIRPTMVELNNNENKVDLRF